LLPSSSLTAPLCWRRLPCWYLLQPKLWHNPKLSLRQLGLALCRRWDPAPLGPGSAIAERFEGASRVYRAKLRSDQPKITLVIVLGAADLQINWCSIRGQAQLGENPKHSNHYGIVFIIVCCVCARVQDLLLLQQH
jgi:hypothetical protein